MTFWIGFGVAVYVCLSLYVATASLYSYVRAQKAKGRKVESQGFLWFGLVLAWILIVLIFGTIKLVRDGDIDWDG